MGLPFIIFWLLLFLCRRELGLKGVLVCTAIWVALVVGFAQSGLPPYVFTVGQVVLDIALVLILFGGDIRIAGGPRGGVGGR